MIDYATITPNRGGERVVMMDFCMQQLVKMNKGKVPDNAFVVDYKAKNKDCDIVPRLRYGIEMAKIEGYEYVFVIESDDWYPADYFDYFKPGYDFYGFMKTTYYNVIKKTYSNYVHPGRSSLFCTGIRIAALEHFRWPLDDYVFIDTKLWEFARDSRKKCNLQVQCPALGIKHNVDGRTAGKGHVMNLRYQDRNWDYLKSIVGDDFEFYYNFWKQNDNRERGII